MPERPVRWYLEHACLGRAVEQIARRAGGGAEGSAGDGALDPEEKEDLLDELEQMAEMAKSCHRPVVSSRHAPVFERLMTDRCPDDHERRASIRTLWQPGRERHLGRAFFPVQVAGEIGALREVHVRKKGEEQEGAPCPRAGAEEAWDEVRRWCRQYIDGAEVDDLEFELIPGRGAERVGGRSMGMAMLVALVGRLTTSRVDMRTAYSGVFRDGRFLAIDPATVAAKRGAVREHPAVERLWLAAGPYDHPEHQTFRDPWELLREVFGPNLAPRRRSEAPPADLERTRAELSLRLAALLQATGGELTTDAAERALDAYAHPLDLMGLNVHRELGMARLGREQVGGRTLRRAHTALARASRDPVRRVVHSHLAGDTLERRRLTLRSAGRCDRAHFERMETLAARIGRGAVVEDLRSGHGLAARMLALAVSAAGGPPSVALMARPLVDARTPADGLLALQALIEVWLYLALGTARAHEPAGVEPLAAGLASRLSERPTLGVLGAALAASTGPGVPERLRVATEELVPLLGHRLAESLNRVLHGLGAWAYLGGLARAGAPEHREHRASATEALVHVTSAAEAVHFAYTEALAGPLLASDSPLWTVVDGHTYYYRGVVGRELRYWSLTRAVDRRCVVSPESDARAILWSDPPPSVALGPPTSLLGGEAEPVPLARVSPGRLPIALARVVARLRQEQGGDELRWLAWLDLGVATLLRLVWFPCLAAEGETEDERRSWLPRGVKLRILQRIVDRPPLAPFDFLHRSPDVFPLVDGLQRLEHLAGPLAASRDLLGHLTERLDRVLARSPWAEERGPAAPGLVGRLPNGDVLSLTGVVARPASAAASEIAAPLAPGEAAFTGTGDGRPRLWPLDRGARFARVVGAGPRELRLWLLTSQRRANRPPQWYTVDLGKKSEIEVFDEETAAWPSETTAGGEPRGDP